MSVIGTVGSGTQLQQSIRLLNNQTQAQAKAQQSSSEEQTESAAEKAAEQASSGGLDVSA